MYEPIGYFHHLNHSTHGIDVLFSQNVCPQNRALGFMCMVKNIFAYEDRCDPWMTILYGVTVQSAWILFRLLEFRGQI